MDIEYYRGFINKVFNEKMILESGLLWQLIDM